MPADWSTTLEIEMRATLLPVQLLWLLALLPNLAAAGALPAGALPLSAYPQETIAIEAPGSFRRHLFEAWRADDYRTRAQGFMFVEDAAVRPDQAMIFVYDPPQVVAMWMKNTQMPLDMLFVDARGCIVRIHQHARPGSLVEIGSGVAVALVVELKSGTAARLGLKTGQRVVRPALNWPPGPAVCTVTTQ
jgi:uncharacterized membrane protein (UPF0127 family)